MVHGEEEGIDRAAPLDGVAVVVECALKASLGWEHPVQLEGDDLVLRGSDHVGADEELVPGAEVVELGGALPRGRHIGRRQPSSLAAGRLLGGSGGLGGCSGHSGGGGEGGRNLGWRRQIDAFDGNVWFVRVGWKVKRMGRSK